LCSRRTYWLHQANLSPDDHHLFPKLKKKLDGPKLKDNHVVETAAT
jgi:hypothetical protein